MNRFLKRLVPGLIVLSATAVGLLYFSLNNPGTLPVWNYKVVNAFPHDTDAFTQGLIFEDGVLYEGTGLPGLSELRKVELDTGKVLQSHKVPAEFFGEGITIYGDRIIQLTYQSNVGFVYDKSTFELLRRFDYPTEGWGITNDGRHLIMSDGTPMLYFLDPETYKQVHKMMVFEEDESVWGLNELEYVEGQIYANVWPTERIARIDPRTGHVVGWIDLEGLLARKDKTGKEDVLNGVAYNPTSGHLFVTGKFWPKLFEIKLLPAK